jgi:hypothetical protein
MKRFWDKVEITKSCWIWRGAISSSGYGSFWFQNRGWKSHRVAFALSRGNLLPGLLVLHKCDNPLCVRPDHLFLGTNLDNNRDMISKGRRVYGNAKLTTRQVQQIKSLLSKGYSQKQVRLKFHISSALVSNIANGRRWK